jgi:hypothetical protein
MADTGRAGRSIPELAREFGPTPWSIALWVVIALIQNQPEYAVMALTEYDSRVG